ncbi:MAG: 50S ribosomal protein L21 [Chlamydiae bacterium CG10_big_fil_rev_8_21_14_0_10_35_9]|nr:MAG: 50S ribosomal protein L21 [Chlamydiae bacterium CG10_big_fil_rev_8_21_14_0_10_35_9]
MYAIIKTGGKQYKVKKGDVINVELLDISPDQPVEFKEILFLNDGKETKIGLPNVENCIVRGEFIGEAKGPKVIAFKYKRRKNYHKTKGHRQNYTQVKITEIALG